MSARLPLCIAMRQRDVRPHADGSIHIVVRLPRWRRINRHRASQFL